LASVLCGKARFQRAIGYRENMSEDEMRERLKAYVMGWKETGEFLEAERRERVRRTDCVQELPVFNGIVLAGLERFPAAPTSGLIEQQRLFMKLHPQKPQAA
jgi:hypothetical protein